LNDAPSREFDLDGCIAMTNLDGILLEADGGMPVPFELLNELLKRFGYESTGRSLSRTECG
jgi:hypothetical protein